MSQLDLAGEAEISQRHLSFLESGRAAPSREMVIRLAERLDIPLRQRNRLLLAAGFAPGYGESMLDDPSLRAGDGAVRMVLKGHRAEPGHRGRPPLEHGGGQPCDRAARWPTSPTPRCSSRRSTCSGSACIRRGSRRSIVNLAEWRAHLLHG